MSTDKWATSKSAQLSAKNWVKLLLLLFFEALELAENLNPLQGPTYTLTPPLINTQNRSKKVSWFIVTCIELCVIIWVKTLYHTEKQGFGYPGFQIKFKTHPPKPAEVKPNFRKVSLLPAKLRMLFPTYLWVREFWPQIYSLSQALDWGLLSKILKMGRA